MSSKCRYEICRLIDNSSLRLKKLIKFSRACIYTIGNIYIHISEWGLRKFSTCENASLSVAYISERTVEGPHFFRPKSCKSEFFENPSHFGRNPEKMTSEISRMLTQEVPM